MSGNLNSDEPGYDVIAEGIMTENHGLIPICTPEEIAQYGAIGENGIFVPYGTDENTPDGNGNPTTPQNPATPSVKKLSQLEILLNAWNDAKATLLSLENELKTLTDSKKTLMNRKTVLEKKTGTESIAVVTARLAAIEKELKTQLAVLTKNTKLKSAEEYEPAKAQTLADFDAIVLEISPLQSQLAVLNNELNTLNVDLAKLKAESTALSKVKPQTVQTKTDIVNKNKETTAKNTEITIKKKEITVKTAEIAKVQTRKTAAANRYNALKGYETKYIYPFRTKTSALNKEKEELTQKLPLLTAELADIKTKLGDRLPALPELIKKQKILSEEAQKAYTIYVQSLRTGNGTGTVQECDTTTGENCDDG